MKTIPVRTLQPEVQYTVEHLKIRRLEEVLDGADLNQEIHRHDFYFFLVVTKGSGNHGIDFIDYTIAQNTLFIMRPGQVHRLQLKTGSEGFLIEFNKHFRFLSADEKELLHKVAAQNYYLITAEEMTSIMPFLEGMVKEYHQKQPGYERVMKACLEIIFIRLQRRPENDRSPANNPKAYQLDKIRQFLTLLEENISTIKQAGVYADMLHLSPFQLNSLTKKLLGKTVTGIIEDQLLLEAKRLLLATSGQVNQIAFQLGYDDPSYFIRLFKKRTGVTPENFRKNRR